MRRIKRISSAALLLLALLAIVGAIVYAGSPGRWRAGSRSTVWTSAGFHPPTPRSALEARSQTVIGTARRVRGGGHAFRDQGLRHRARARLGGCCRLGAPRRRRLRPVARFPTAEAAVLRRHLAATATYDETALKACSARMAAKVDRPHREAAVVLHGLTAGDRVLPAPGASSTGRPRPPGDRRPLASLGRGTAGALPLKVDVPRVTGATLARALADRRGSPSPPRSCSRSGRRGTVPRWRVATLLELPANGATKLRVGGAGADDYFKRNQKVVDTPAHDATFVVARTESRSSRPSTPVCSTCRRRPTACSAPRCGG